jgi:antitoxin VapB
MTTSRLTPCTPAVPSPPKIAIESVAIYAGSTEARTVKLFRNGANQAVRISKEFELPGVDALIHREGNKLIIEPVKPKLKKGSAAAFLAALDELAKLGPCEDEFPDIGDEGLLPLDDIDFGDDTL